MQGLLRRAARTLLTAGVLSLIHPALAQEALPQLQPIPNRVAQPAIATPLTGDAFLLPRIVTPAPVAAKPVAPIQPKWVSSPSTPTEKVDLLKVPTLPTAWAVDTIKPPPKKIAESLPAVASVPGTSKPPVTRITWLPDTSKPPTPAVAPLPTVVTPVPQLSPLPVKSVEVALTPPAQPAPKKVHEAWAVQHQPPAVKKNEWPAAFIEYERSTPPTVPTIR